MIGLLLALGMSLGSIHGSLVFAHTPWIDSDPWIDGDSWND